MPLPPEFLERFNRIVPEKQRQIIATTFNATPQSITVRINTLLISIEEARATLKEMNIDWTPSGICDEVICIQNRSMESLRDEEFIRNGLLYPLKMASVIPVVELDPQPGERIMDLCAAPGGKTSHIAARMQNEGFLFAVEPIRGRFFKLRANCERTGVKNATFKQVDGRMIRPDREGFDKVLVDAPCSSESRFEIDKPKTYAYWSLRKIKEMRKKQIGLIRSGIRCLKPGGTLVYSTCTFAPEENEGVIQYIQRKFKDEIELLPVNTAQEFQYPVLREWEGKEFNVILRQRTDSSEWRMSESEAGVEASEVSGLDPSTVAQDDRNKPVISSDSREINSGDSPSKASSDKTQNLIRSLPFGQIRPPAETSLRSAQDDKDKRDRDKPVISSDSLRRSDESARRRREINSGDSSVGMARYTFPQDGSAFFVAKLKKR